MSSSNFDNSTNLRLVDIGVNLTNKAFRKNWQEVVQRAADSGVDRIVLTGTEVNKSRESLKLAQEWQDKVSKSNKNKKQANLYCTAGVHPHYAKSFDKSKTRAQLKQMLSNPLVVAAGECGLDYNRNFSTKEEQLYAFEQQVQLACELQMPMFLHEREAHHDLLKVLDRYASKLPPIVVHCFTGTLEEANAYIDRGFYIGFTGTIGKHERGAPLRRLLPRLPLERLMLETDAPFMAFVKGKGRTSEPAHVVELAHVIGETMNVSFATVCAMTTHNAVSFFGLDQQEAGSVGINSTPKRGVVAKTFELSTKDPLNGCTSKVLELDDANWPALG